MRVTDPETTVRSWSSARLAWCSNPRSHVKEEGVAAPAYSPQAGETETGGLWVSGPVVLAYLASS